MCKDADGEAVESGERYKRSDNEQKFKIDWIRSHAGEYADVFCIETEETVGGFPDAIAIDGEGRATFIEFKVCDRQGRMQFQPTQPAFYRGHPHLNVFVVALHRGCGMVDPPLCVKFRARRLFDDRLLSLRGCASIHLVKDAMLAEWGDEK